MVLDFGDDIVRRGVLDPSQNRDRERTFQLSHEHSHGRSAFDGMDDRLGKKESPFRQKGLPKKELLFLVLSGFATAGSWLCYYDAIAQGQVSVVVRVDKLSVLLTALFSVLVLKEKLRWKSWLGLAFWSLGPCAWPFSPKGFQNSTSGLK